MASTTSSVKEQALELLGQGVGSQTVASALGVSVSQISQYLAEPEFAAAVTQRRYLSLQESNKIDDKYTTLEARLQEKLENSLIFLTNPDKILRALQVVNGAKRRGVSAPQELNKTDEVVQLTMPTVVQNFYTHNDIAVNINNQVVKAGNQELVTIQSGNMNTLLKQASLPAPDVVSEEAKLLTHLMSSPDNLKEKSNVGQTNSS